MSNFDLWQLYMRNTTSPQTWIDFGFYFLISAALQRRVWLYGAGDDGTELYPNQYICYVGRPGLGKGLVTRPVARLLRHHKLPNSNLIKTNVGLESPPLFAMGSDSQTFEQLLEDLAESIRRVARPGNPKPYIHTSYAFCLEELDSLFKTKTKDVTSFLKNAYDCGAFEYKTKHQGKQLLRYLCVSLLAGTQPDFFATAQKTGLFGEGFGSRTLWLFADKVRFSRFHNTELDDDQKDAEKQLLSYIQKLSLIYGPVTYTEETASFLEDWMQVHHAPKELTAHPRMQEYLARKKVMMLKLAMAMHFSEEISFVLPLPTIQKALATFDAIEPALEKGLGCAGKNPNYIYHSRILSLIANKTLISEREIVTSFIQDIPIDEIKAILSFLEEMKEVRVYIEKGMKVYRK